MRGVLAFGKTGLPAEGVGLGVWPLDVRQSEIRLKQRRSREASTLNSQTSYGMNDLRECRKESAAGRSAFLAASSWQLEAPLE